MPDSRHDVQTAAGADAPARAAGCRPACAPSTASFSEKRPRPNQRVELPAARNSSSRPSESSTCWIRPSTRLFSTISR